MMRALVSLSLCTLSLPFLLVLAQPVRHAHHLCIAASVCEVQKYGGTEVRYIEMNYI
jgi:hypothetical protein